MQRQNRPEAMDAPHLDARLLAEDLRNLAALNRWFGGWDVVRRRIAAVLRSLPPERALTVLDVGSGAGDLCRCIADRCRADQRALRLWSLDHHPQIQSFARVLLADYPEVRFLRGDACRLPLRDGVVEVALCTLALHHFSDDDAVRVLAELRRVSRHWVVVSDLSRSPAALAAVWLATRFCRNPMTRQDGPQSVERAFTPQELRRLARAAGWPEPRVSAEPWFRMSLVHRGEGA